MTAAPRTSRRTRRRVLAAASTLGVLVLVGAPSAALADDADGSGVESTTGPVTDEVTPAPGAEQTSPASPSPGPSPTGDADPTADPSAEVTQPGDDQDPRENDAADDAPSATPTPAATPSDDSGAADDEGDVRALAAPAPDFGTGKYRVGVQIASGAYVPEGTTTAGTELTVTFTNGGDPQTCTTGTAGADGSSFCDGYVTGPQGGTVTATQQGANAGLVAGPAVSVESCTGGGTIPGLDIDIPCQGSDLVVTDNGTPPRASGDEATTEVGAPVDVDVLANDDDGNGAPLTDYSVSTAPGHGTASFVASGGGAGTAAIVGGPVVRYVPQAGFSGVDTFAYTFTTANGSATGRVSVQVGTPAAPATPSTPSTPSSGGGSVAAARTATSSAVDTATPATGNLPDTGGPEAALLGVAAGLVAAGGLVTVVSRRRTRV
ncbi:hypothetical protein GCM10011519_19310 [Marmoricola endophyticus]|uniref:LPXTG cell wall anchor domain-containing protein n=1 Tax=Marmoricola endophyticus TaxID=2040280 RepID=A0A917BLJ1_9ACTN|nr:Ig-like domain-containing protein [Marmoricola endophyticus]GGF45541.1 hypothetical protein GCM10011519_19310 [Marmoricola endophyticus]